MGYDYHNPENIRIGGIVKDFREARGLSRLELGNLVGCQYNTIGAIERAQRNCTAPMRRKIVDALGVPLSVFTNNAIRREHLNALRNEVRPLETNAA